MQSQFDVAYRYLEELLAEADRDFPPPAARRPACHQDDPTHPAVPSQPPQPQSCRKELQVKET